MLLTGPRSKEGKRNQRLYSSQVISEIDGKLREQQYLEMKERELLQNKKMRSYFESFFLEEFAQDELVLEVGMKSFEAWHSYQQKRNYKLAVNEIRQRLSSFSPEVHERFELILLSVEKAVAEENMRIQKQMQRELLKKELMKLTAKK